LKDLTFQRTNGKNPEFLELVTLLDASLAKSDGDLHSFYNQFNGLEDIKHILVAYAKNKAVACGAIKEFDKNSAEIKRMFTLPEYRGKGVGSQILSQLEAWATELYFTSCILETGKRQPDAIALYRKNSYLQITNYGQYKGKENSVCFQKILLDS
jgi:putative acetyltransferase